MHTGNQSKTRVRTSHVHPFQLFTPALLQGVAWPFGRFALDFFTHLKIRGRENIERAAAAAKQDNVGVLFAINHTHELDFSFPLVALPPFSQLFPMFYVAHAREKYSNTRAFGWRRYIYGLPIFLTSWGAHPYIANQRNYELAMPTHVDLLRKGKSICIFPEGKIRKDASAPRTHGGVGYLVEATNAVVVPVAVSGVQGMSFKEFLTRKRSLKISYGTPIRAAQLIDTSRRVPERYQIAAENIMGTITAMRSFQQHSVHVTSEPSATK